MVTFKANGRHRAPSYLWRTCLAASHPTNFFNITYIYKSSFFLLSPSKKDATLGCIYIYIFSTRSQRTFHHPEGGSGSGSRCNVFLQRIDILSLSLSLSIYLRDALPYTFTKFSPPTDSRYSARSSKTFHVQLSCSIFMLSRFSDHSNVWSDEFNGETRMNEICIYRFIRHR